MRLRRAVSHSPHTIRDPWWIRSRRNPRYQLSSYSINFRLVVCPVGDLFARLLLWTLLAARTGTHRRGGVGRANVLNLGWPRGCRGRRTEANFQRIRQVYLSQLSYLETLARFPLSSTSSVACNPEFRIHVDVVTSARHRYSDSARLVLYSGTFPAGFKP